MICANLKTNFKSKIDIVLYCTELHKVARDYFIFNYSTDMDLAL